MAHSVTRGCPAGLALCVLSACGGASPSVEGGASTGVADDDAAATDGDPGPMSTRGADTTSGAETTAGAGAGSTTGASATRGGTAQTGTGATSAMPSTSTGIEGSGGEDESGASSSTGAAESVVYAEDFDGPNGAPWPAPWTPAGTAIVSSDLSAGQARMAGQTTTVGRMVAPGFDEVDVEATVTVTFNNIDWQGFGFYVRQNGGALQQTATHGEGYAVFVEGHGQPAIGVWREVDGVEELLAETLEPLGGAAASGVPYRIRFACQQAGETTMLRAKIWPVDEAEPDDWQVEHSDATPQLQHVAGSFAVDIYNYAGQGSLYLDDLVVQQP